MDEDDNLSNDANATPAATLGAAAVAGENNDDTTQRPAATRAAATLTTTATNAITIADNHPDIDISSSINLPIGVSVSSTISATGAVDESAATTAAAAATAARNTEPTFMVDEASAASTSVTAVAAATAATTASNTSTATPATGSNPTLRPFAFDVSDLSDTDDDVGSNCWPAYSSTHGAGGTGGEGGASGGSSGAGGSGNANDGGKSRFFFRTSSAFSLSSREEVASIVNAECCRGGATPDLDSIMDTLFNPGTPIDNLDNIEWIRWLIAGGRTPQEFVKIVRSYDNHAKCGLVWVPHVVAYRCRTCGISPCMSICRDCFKKGNHTNHDFNMFLSQAGGACDCGDTSVMKAEGFCSDHGINNRANKEPVPANLLAVAEAIMPKLLFRLLQHFRERSDAPTQTYSMAAYSCEEFANMLIDLNNMGEIMRKVMTRALINPNVYKHFTELPCLDTRHGRFLKLNREKYEDALNRFPRPEPPDDYKHLPALGEKLVHTTLLEEFIFWTFKYEFPQNLVCFLLNMLPDQDYKEHLTRTFVMHYSRIPSVLEMSRDPDTLSNRVVHMSVQLFSNESLALKMVNELSLLHVMIISLKLMMSKILIQNTLHDPAKNFHFVIDCTRPVMKDHCYWPLVSDFNNVLSHESVALVFLRDDNLIDMWFQFLSMLQGMNVNVRETTSHVEFEPNSYYAAFSCELEASAYPMWSIISHLQDGTHAHLAKKIISYCINTLHEWIDAIYFVEPKLSMDEMMRASFHFPLHRYLAAFVCQAVTKMGMSLSDLLPPGSYILPLLMIHPLRVQSFFYEILAGKWVRNGLQIKGQAMTYIQANFCNSMADMDLFFLQICATNLSQFFFLQNTIELFGVGQWLVTAPLKMMQKMEQSSMLEGFLTFLATLVTSRTNLGNDEATQCIIEISALLATENKTHSQLIELMPERSGNVHTKNFETFLKQLSVYKAPSLGSDNLEQGLFTPIDEVWEQYYDPLHVLLRAVHRRDFQSSLDRFTNYVKSKNKMPASGNLWPPFRLPRPVGPAFTDPCRILNSRVFHSTILSILYRAVHSRDVSEHLLALAIFLLEIAVETSDDTNGASGSDMAAIAECEPKGSYPFSMRRGPPKLFNCYATDNLSCNLRQVVTRLSLKLHEPQVTPANYRSNPFYPDIDFDVEADVDTTPIGALPMIGVGATGSEDDDDAIGAIDDIAGGMGMSGLGGIGMGMGMGDMAELDDPTLGADPTMTAMVPLRLQNMEVALPPDLSVVHEQGLVIRQDSQEDDEEEELEEAELRQPTNAIEAAAAAAAASPSMGFRFHPLALRESGMEVAIVRDLWLARPRTRGTNNTNEPLTERLRRLEQQRMSNRRLQHQQQQHQHQQNVQPPPTTDMLMSSPSNTAGSAGMLLPFARVQPVAVPSSNSDIVPSNALGRVAVRRSFEAGARKRTVENAIGEQNKDEISIDESILSLLLKLHSQLSGTLDSFSLSDGEELDAEFEIDTQNAGHAYGGNSNVMGDGTEPMDVNSVASNVIDIGVDTSASSSCAMDVDCDEASTSSAAAAAAAAAVVAASANNINVNNATDTGAVNANLTAAAAAASAASMNTSNTTSSQRTANTASTDSTRRRRNYRIRVSESRIGDGPHFIGNLLRKIAQRDELCAQSIDEIRARLWPNQREKQAEQRARETKEKEERRKRARERQQKMMQEFANKQKEFMQAAAAAHNMECGGGGGGVGGAGGIDGAGSILDDDYDDEAYEEQPREKEYDCIICNCTTPSTETNPIGLVVLVESSGIVGHRRRNAERLSLPLSADDEERLKHSTRLATEFARRTELMGLKFGEESWYLSHNTAYENGVHVQSCGHHVHLSCLDAYLKTLYAAQRQHLYERGEFYCPVCRQLSNSVLPLSPQLDRPTPVVRSGTRSFEQLVAELTNLIKENERPPTSKLSEAMGRAMEDMTNMTHRKGKRKQPTFSSLFIFVTSIARTNLESEIIQRGGSLCTANSTRYKPKRDCIVPLLHVLSVHVRVLIEWPLWRSWASLAGLPVNDTAPVPVQFLEVVPSLLGDPIALLIKFILLAPLHLDQEYFTCMVKVMYNLLYYQIVVQLCVTLTDLECDYILSTYNSRPSAEATTNSNSSSNTRRSGASGSNQRSYLGCAMALVLNLTNRLSHLRRDSLPTTSADAAAAAAAASSSSSHTSAGAGGSGSGGASVGVGVGSAGVEVNLKSMEMQLQSLCLPFLRIAALLRQHLYHHEMPEISAPGLEFVRLVYYLELVTDSMDWDCFNASKGLCFISGTEQTLPKFWCEQLMDIRPPSDSTRELIMINQHSLWQQPKLLQLPREYERLFTYYHERPCLNCYKVPKESSICLLCGTIVCLKQNCCAKNECCEAVRHTISCGGGIGIFLVVTSTYIIVIRGRRACLWGSLYLDDFDEEDRDLKRGKPLYLSQDRFNLLESQWLSHKFAHTKHTWVFHRDLL